MRIDNFEPKELKKLNAILKVKEQELKKRLSFFQKLKIFFGSIFKS